MSILTPIKGIYYSIGSKDIPQSYNFYDKYGFDGNYFSLPKYLQRELRSIQKKHFK